MKKVTKLSIVLGMLISCLFFPGCDKSDDIENIEQIAVTEINIEDITPKAIVDGEINIKTLTKEQQKQFLIDHFFINKVENMELGKRVEAGHLIINNLEINDIYNSFNTYLKQTGLQTPEDEKWKSVHILKEYVNAKFNKSTFKFDKAPNDPYNDINFENFYRESIEKSKNSLKENGIDISSLDLKSSNCPVYPFNFNGIKSTTSNQECYSVVNADNEYDDSCDYMACYFGNSIKLHATNILMDFLITNPYIGFGGYHNIIIRQKWFKTYVLLGGDRVDAFLFIVGGALTPEEFITQSLKLKV